MAGLTAIGIGIWMQIDPGRYNDFLGDYTFTVPSATLIASGLFVCFVGGCGCWGALRENKCMLGTYFFMLLVVFCAEMAAGILAFLYRNEIENTVTKESKDIILNKFGMGNQDIDYAVNLIQQELKCCGADNDKDYQKSQWYLSSNNKDKRVPESCCNIQTRCVADTKSPYTNGCISEMSRFLKDNMIIIGTVGVALACTQILGLISACILFFSIDKSYNDM